MKTLIALTVLVSALLAALAFGHDTWLIADQSKIAPNRTVILNLTSGMAFPALEVAPRRERVGNALCRLSGRTFEISDSAAGPKSLQFKANLPEPGVATFWLKLPRREIELKPEQVKEYLDEVSAPESLRQQWNEMKEPKRWRESYTKHPKTFVRVGDSKSDQSWKEPIGMALEIVPENDPTALRAGDELVVRVIKEGKPWPDFALNAVREGEIKGETRKTDAAGRVTFPMNKAGRWLLRGTDIRKSDRADTDFESDFTTLTVEVNEKTAASG